MDPKTINNKVSIWEIFLGLILLNVLLGIIVFVFPSGEIKISENKSLQFVSKANLLSNENSKQVDVDTVIAGLKTIDTSLNKLDPKTLAKIKLEKFDVPESKQIQYPDNTQLVLEKFFNALVSCETNQELIRIIHYGDSQLEGDRISDYLRNRLQLRFGGEGPGIILPIDISNSRVSVRQSESKNWVKYAIYGKSTSAINGLYGIGASSYKYNGGYSEVNGDKTITQVVKKYLKKQIKIDSTFKYVIDSNKFYYDTVVSKMSFKNGGAWLKLLNATSSYPRFRTYSKISLLYGADEAFYVHIKADNKEIKEEIPAAVAAIKTWDVGAITNGTSLNFSGKSPFLFGVALDGKSGVAVDNFPMRGSSALGFDRMNQEMLNKLYIQSNTKLIILQYGINLVPSPRSNYDWYAKTFANQLAAIKMANPDMSILVIGPSDMSRKQGGEIVSYPNITLIRDAMRNAAFSNGCAFWDLFTAMGGHNSMNSWVKEGLAAKDYTHFSSKGAAYVGEMLYNTLIDEYNKYLNAKGLMPQ